MNEDITKKNQIESSFNRNYKKYKRLNREQLTLVYTELVKESNRIAGKRKAVSQALLETY